MQRSASCGGGGCVGGRSSRPPARPGGPGGPPEPVLRGSAPTRGERTAVLCPRPSRPTPPRLPPQASDAGLAPGEAARRRWPPAWESSSPSFIERLLSANTMPTFLTSYLSAYSPHLGRLSSVDRGEGKGPVVWRPTVGVSGLPGEGCNEANQPFKLGRCY